MPAFVLLFNIEEKKAAFIRMQLAVMKIRSIAVDPADFDQTIAAILGLEAKTGKVCEAPFREEMLLLGNFSRAQLDAFLGSFAKNRVPPVALKAMLTGTNVGWTAQRLASELSEEHERILQMKREKERSE